MLPKLSTLFATVVVICVFYMLGFVIKLILSVPSFLAEMDESKTNEIRGWFSGAYDVRFVSTVIQCKTCSECADTEIFILHLHTV